MLQPLGLLPRVIRDRLVRGRIRLDGERLRGLRVNVATTRAEVFGAARLVHDSYVARGIMTPHSSGLKLHPQMVLPSSVIFVGSVDGEIVGTLSLVEDSPLGLPMDGSFSGEVNGFRTRGERVAEVSALAIAPRFRKSGAVYLLNRLMARTAIRAGIDRLVMTVHPRAEKLYESAMLFETFGGERSYAGLERSARAVAMSLLLRGVGDRYQRAFGNLGPVAGNAHYFHFEMECPAIEELSAETIARSDERIAASESLARERMDLFRGLSAAKLAFLRTAMPGVFWPSRSRPDFGEVAHPFHSAPVPA